MIALAQPPFLFMTGAVVTIDGGMTLGKGLSRPLPASGWR